MEDFTSELANVLIQSTSKMVGRIANQREESEMKKYYYTAFNAEGSLITGFFDTLKEIETIRASNTLTCFYVGLTPADLLGLSKGK